MRARDALARRIYCRICRRPLPLKRLLRGGTECSDRCHKKFERWRRNYRASRYCRLCGRGAISNAERVRNLAKMRGCWYCGGSMRKPTLSYLMPLSQGGSDSVRNTVLACASCVRAKGNRTLEEYRTVRGGRVFAGEMREKKRLRELLLAGT